MKIEVVQGDITKFTGDAVVNAANVRLLGGGGVDGAIHSVAGPALAQWILANVPVGKHEIRCPTGKAVYTPGFGLPAKHIIHTVGPIFHDSPRARNVVYAGEIAERATLADKPRDLLASAIRESLKLAEAKGIKTLAMPAISCGVFGGNLMTFAKVLSEVAREKAWSLDTLTVVLFLDDEFTLFKTAWEICKA